MLMRGHMIPKPSAKWTSMSSSSAWALTQRIRPKTEADRVSRVTAGLRDAPIGVYGGRRLRLASLRNAWRLEEVPKQGCDLQLAALALPAG